jgi:hypothetical protein
MDLGRAKSKLRDGYCLWVGAGLTKQLWASALQWDELTKRLEARAELAEEPSARYPERLQRCSDKLGSAEFRRYLRRMYYTDLCESMLRKTAQALNGADGVPPEVWKIAGLGQMANPIVSFNIESFSSTLLARPGGPARIIPFVDRQNRRIEFQELGKIFQRIVYHPHGLSTVDCIMTEQDYQRLNGTLALELAVHTAFGNDLAIVGLSLQDEYLRQQISKFRSAIDSILWFNTQFGGLEGWAMVQQVDMVRVEWSEFWETWNTDHVPYESLMIAWCRVVDDAAAELSGGKFYQIGQSFEDEFIREKMLSDSAKIGEPGELRLVDGQEPSNIQRKFRELVNSRNIRIPVALHYPRGA